MNKLGELYQWFTDTYAHQSLEALKAKLKVNIASIYAMMDFLSKVIAYYKKRNKTFANISLCNKRSWSGGKLTVEKIHIGNCPVCGGKMKYINKPIECIYNYGSTKREITKRQPALQCKRNPKHWYEVDLAEDKLR